MKEIFQRDFFNYLNKKKINDFIGVPDSTMKYFIDEGLKKNKIIVATREEEAIGIAAGIVLIKEAGGIMNYMDLNRKDRIDVKTSSSAINEKMLEKLKNF